LSRKHQKVIRADSEASIGTVGLFGGNYINITRGGLNQPVLPAGATIRTEDRSASLNCDEIAKTLSRVFDTLTSPASRK
jgi:ABC-type transporter Mla subunit MlaD